MDVLFLQKLPVQHMGLMRLSSILDKNGHRCELLIEELEKDFFETAKNKNPDMVAFSCATDKKRWTLNVAKSMKRMTDAYIVLGGPHATFHPEIIENDQIDFICRGEGEEALLELVEKIEGDECLRDIENIWLKDDDEIIKNDPRPLIQDLDGLPFPDRELYSEYYEKLNNLEMGQYFLTGRGCPYNCSFCFNKKFRELYSVNNDKYVRKRGVEDVIEEISRVKEKFDLRRIDFVDDTFNIDREWLLKFLNEYKERISLPFICNLRADLLTEEILDALKEAGCTWVRFGIEQGNDHLRNDILNKNLSKEDIRKAAELVKERDLKLHTFNMLGVPGKGLSSAIETLDLNLEIGTDFAFTSLLQPYRGTDIGKYIRDKGLVEENPDTSFYRQSTLKVEDINEIKNLQNFFQICLDFPSLIPIVKKLIKLPPNRLFEWVYKLSFTYYHLKEKGVNFWDFVKWGFHMKSLYD